VIESLPGIDLVATCKTATELERAVESGAVDVVVTEIRPEPHGTDDGIARVARLREQHPDVGVVILEHVIDADHAARLFQTGSSGWAYIREARIGSPGALERAILTVADGGSVTDPDVVVALVSERMRHRASPRGRLTPRELEVLALVADGMSNPSIASRLFLTKRAVEKHINSIYAKLDLPDESLVCRRVRAAQLFTPEQARGTTAPPLAAGV
jgi:DNA-binding NarL/FixJ family response regulator